MKANLDVDLLVIVYEIRNDTVFHHSTIISSNMALGYSVRVFYPANTGPTLAYCCPTVYEVGQTLHMYNSAMPYIEALASIYQVENRFIRISNISATATHAQLIFHSQ